MSEHQYIVEMRTREIILHRVESRTSGPSAYGSIDGIQQNRIGGVG